MTRESVRACADPLTHDQRLGMGSRCAPFAGWSLSLPGCCAGCCWPGCWSACFGSGWLVEAPVSTNTAVVLPPDAALALAAIRSLHVRFSDGGETSAGGLDGGAALSDAALHPSRLVRASATAAKRCGRLHETRELRDGGEGGGGGQDFPRCDLRLSRNPFHARQESGALVSLAARVIRSLKRECQLTTQARCECVTDSQ